MITVATKVHTVIGLPEFDGKIEVSPPVMELVIVLELLTPPSELRDVVHVAQHWWFLKMTVLVLPLDAHLPTIEEH